MKNRLKSEIVNPPTGGRIKGLSLSFVRFESVEFKYF